MPITRGASKDPKDPKDLSDGASESSAPAHVAIDGPFDDGDGNFDDHADDGVNMGAMVADGVGMGTMVADGVDMGTVVAEKGTSVYQNNFITASPGPLPEISGFFRH